MLGNGDRGSYASQRPSRREVAFYLSQAARRAEGGPTRLPLPYALTRTTPTGPLNFP